MEKQKEMIAAIFDELKKRYGDLYLKYEYSQTEAFHYILIYSKDLYNNQQFVQDVFRYQQTAFQAGIDNFGVALANAKERNELRKKIKESGIVEVATVCAIYSSTKIDTNDLQIGDSSIYQEGHEIGVLSQYFIKQVIATQGIAGPNYLVQGESNSLQVECADVSILNEYDTFSMAA